MLMTPLSPTRHHIYYMAMALSLTTAISAGASPVTEADPVYADTLTLDEVSVTAIKQGLKISDQPVASTTVRSEEIDRLNILTMKDVSEIAPNFYIPSYGSRMTSSIYVRGIGARIDQPVVGLNVDNVPFLNKDNYDFDLFDIERIEVLRGPQSTLYGRNTMGGQVNIYTLSPFRYQGGRLLAQGGNGPLTRMGIGWYKKFSERLAMSWNGYFNYCGGFFKNLFDGYHVGREKNFAFRWKTDARLGNGWTLENAAALTFARQEGYPYAYEPTGEINYNDTTYYRRNAFNDGLTVRWSGNKISVSSITSFQYIDDCMTLDQDFLPLDYFTLTQDRKEWAVTQDFVAKGDVGRYSWLGGLFGFYRHTDMDAPVTFKQFGIKKLIEEKRNEANPDYPISWFDPEFVLGSHFKYPVHGLALYHQSTLRLGRFTLSGGLRLDYEHARLDYRSVCNTAFIIKHIEPDGTETIFRREAVDIDDSGKLSKSFVQLLPKIALTWNIPGKTNSNLFASVAKGYKSGGFNTQMFSDVLQQRLMRILGLGVSYDVDDIVSYKPEKSWNYEIGAHIECAGGKVLSDVALFYIDCRDQQMTVFPDGTTTGRMTTNAGRTRSIGAEIAVRYRPISRLLMNVSYGFTDARFVKFNNGQTDYAHKCVPYAPRNTFFAGATYTLPLVRIGSELEFNANVRGIGPIYWDEANSSKQGFYALPSASVTMRRGALSLQAWCENISGTRYNVFSFVSIGNRFVQRGNPRTYGVTLRVNFETGKPLF